MVAVVFGGDAVEVDAVLERDRVARVAVAQAIVESALRVRGHVAAVDADLAAVLHVHAVEARVQRLQLVRRRLVHFGDDIARVARH